MYQGNLTIVYPSGTHMNPKRTLQSRSLSRDVIIGIVLAVVAVIACTLVAILLWHLHRQSRFERRRAARQVDLLAPELTDARSTPIPFGDPDKLRTDEPWDKPLPRTPSAIPMHPAGAGPKSVQGSQDIADGVRRPLRILHRPGERRTSGLDANPQDASIQDLSLNIPPTSFDTTFSSLPGKPTRAKTNSISSIGKVQTNSTKRSWYTATTSEDSISDIQRGQFAIVNVTDTDVIRFDRARLLSHNVLPDYTVGQVRGRDAPFSQKWSRPKRSVSALSPVTEKQERVLSSVSSGEKPGISDIPSPSVTSYMVQVPLPRFSRTPPSPLLLQRERSPLTLTASYPVSSVVVGDIGAVRRPDGSKGKGRMVTMSVLMDDSDSATSVMDASEARQNSSRDPRPNSTSSESSQDFLEFVLAGYATDLPPYSPFDEEWRIPKQ